MFRRGVRAVVAPRAGRARCEGHNSWWAVTSCGAAAAAALAAASDRKSRRRRDTFLACEGFDWISAGFGGIAVGAGVYIALTRSTMREPATPSFEKRLRRAYTRNAVARAVLADTPQAHPELMKVAFASEKDIGDTGLAVANYIRGMWAEILSEAFHCPKSFFIATRIPLEDRRGPISTSIGRYKVKIPLLKKNKRAMELGVDRLAEAFDRNHDGVLDFHEFATLILVQADFCAEQKGLRKRSKAEMLHLLYAVLDDNGDGRVTRDEFESFLVMAARVGIATELDTACYARYWREFDADQDQVMSYKEFVAFASRVLDMSQFSGEFPVLP